MLGVSVIKAIASVPAPKSFTIDDVYALLQGLQSSEEMQIAANTKNWNDREAGLNKTIKDLDGQLQVQMSKCLALDEIATGLENNIHANQDKIDANNKRRDEIHAQLLDLKKKRCQASLLFVNALRNNFQAMRALKAVRIGIQTGKLPDSDSMPLDDDNSTANATNSTNGTTTTTTSTSSSTTTTTTSTATGTTTTTTTTTSTATNGSSTSSTSMPSLVEMTPHNVFQIFAGLTHLMTDTQLENLRLTLLQSGVLDEQAPNVSKCHTR
jgi:hypothetical protein